MLRELPALMLDACSNPREAVLTADVVRRVSALEDIECISALSKYCPERINSEITQFMKTLCRAWRRLKNKM